LVRDLTAVICVLLAKLPSRSPQHESVVILNFLDTVLCDYFTKKELSTVVQIGANDGRINDPIFTTIQKFKAKTRILLIEPQSNVIAHLKENYAEHPGARICCAAIGPDRHLTMYRLRPEFYESLTRRYLETSPSYRVPTGFTSFSKEHVLDHLAGNLPEGLALEDAIDTMEVPCYQLIQLIRHLGWEAQGIDFLQIDTEGMDDLTIQSANIELLKPTLINFEHRHLSGQRLGTVLNHLHALGYRTHAWNADDTLAVLGSYPSHVFDANLIKTT
jgi:hypothetical protein